MNKYIILLILSLMFTCITFAQSIKIIDNTTLQPLSNVAIYSLHPKASVITNIDGLADVSSFKDADSIWISHLSYNTEIFSFIELKLMNFKISLSEKSFSHSKFLS